MAKRTKAKPPLTKNKLDRAFKKFIADGAAPRAFKVDKDAPRFTLQTKKVPRKEALRRKNVRIREAQQDLKNAMAAPLEKMEQVFVKHRPGSKKWNDAYYEQQRGYPLICSPETSRLICEGSKNKSRK